MIVQCIAAQIPSTLEPTCLSRSDGKRPDGVTIAPWKTGHMLVWDASCTDTFAISHLAQSVKEARAVTGLAEQRKRSKDETLAWTHNFIPVVVVTSGVFALKPRLQRLEEESMQSHTRPSLGPF